MSDGANVVLWVVKLSSCGVKLGAWVVKLSSWGAKLEGWVVKLSSDGVKLGAWVVKLSSVVAKLLADGSKQSKCLVYWYSIDFYFFAFWILGFWGVFGGKMGFWREIEGDRMD